MGYCHYILWQELNNSEKFAEFHIALNEMGEFLKKCVPLSYAQGRLIGPVLRSDIYFKKSYEQDYLSAGKLIIWYDDNPDVRAICFNGSRDNEDDYEDFLLFREEFLSRKERFSCKTCFCRTNRRNYDYLVVGCLVILNHFIPKIVCSDSGYMEWMYGVKAVNKILGASYENLYERTEPTYLEILFSVASSPLEQQTKKRALCETSDVPFQEMPPAKKVESIEEPYIEVNTPAYQLGITTKLLQFEAGFFNSKKFTVNTLDSWLGCLAQSTTIITKR